MKRLLSIIILSILSISIFAQAELKLTWNASTDNVGVEGYNVWLDGEYYGTVSDTFIYLTLDPGIYVAAVSAFDAAGNESEKSETLIIDITDNLPPSAPDSLLLIYPNPTYGDFRLSITREIEPGSVIRILSPNGQILHQRLVTNLNPHIEFFNMRELNSGIYIVDLIEDGVRSGVSHLIIVKNKWQEPDFIKSVKINENLLPKTFVGYKPSNPEKKFLEKIW